MVRKYLSYNKDNIRHSEQKKGLLVDIKRDKYLIILILPVLIYLFIFNYIPIYGILISFRDFRMGDKLFTFGADANWVGLKHFKQFFTSMYCQRVITNTVTLSALMIGIGFSMPIIFALIVNEIKNMAYKRIVQTLSYLPHFISVVIIVGMIMGLTSKDGIVNTIIELLGGKRTHLLNESQYFRAIYVISGIWQTFGWNSILYLSGIASIDPGIYESAKIDGANRFKQIIYITLPGLKIIIALVLILSLGTILSTDTYKIFLLYNPATYETADVIGTFVMRTGIFGGSYSFATAVSLFSTIVNFTLLMISNSISRRLSGTTLL